jgi:hypothetical protein
MSDCRVMIRVSFLTFSLIWSAGNGVCVVNTFKVNCHRSFVSDFCCMDDSEQMIVIQSWFLFSLIVNIVKKIRQS